jgi:serine/threonine protein phosphatase 1
MSKRLFAIGDVHGCFDKLKALIEGKIHLQKSDKLILLGDYIDRGSQSKEVIDYIVELKEKGFDIIPLRGNHEDMLIDFIFDKKNLSLWIQNGGSETLKSFGISSLESFESKYIDFFKDLPYYSSYEEFLFVHAGFNDEANNPFEDKRHMIWKCRENYKHLLLENKIIVHGHYPIKESILKKQLLESKSVINVDTGCVFSDKVGYGKLSAIELYTKILYSV